MIHHGDLFNVLPTLDAESIDACVTDPPYDLTSGKRGGSGAASLNLSSPAGRSRITTGGGFMGMEWDGTGVAFDPFAWATISRALKPGAHLVAFGGTRTFHRMTCAIEDAGFEIRDCLSWLYGSGFPKSLNLPGGLGTALKPSWEPIILARKPTRGTVAQNVEAHGTAALNIEACRIGDEPIVSLNGLGQNSRLNDDGWKGVGERPEPTTNYGRWPSNVILDEEAAAMLDEQTGELVSGANPTRRGSDKFRGVYSDFAGQEVCEAARGTDIGGASRFYYVAKPSREERDFGTRHLLKVSGNTVTGRKADSPGAKHSARAGTTQAQRSNIHPTVKPVELMRWLVRLVTPVNGLVLDPFTGSGTTGMACRYEQRRFIGIEREADYVQIAEARIAAVAPLFGEASA